MKAINFEIEKKNNGLARAGIIHTLNGSIKTPAFVAVGTKATVKALTPEQIKETGAQVVLGNTYHLHLEPGSEIVKKSGGIGKFMNWKGPTMTDSGGFQVFSLGAAFGKNISKITDSNETVSEILLDEFTETTRGSRGFIPPNFKPAKIEEDGVYFRSHIDGSAHFFTPEKSMEIQHNLGADIIFAFDECTSPNESIFYQREALDRTHRWAKRSLEYHLKSGNIEKQGLFGIVQGGRDEKLRKESAKFVGRMDFDGFGIGGSFQKFDMSNVVKWVNEILPEDKPRHLLGIGEPEDLFMAVENGCDLFDCVTPTRHGRNGSLYTHDGKINIKNSKYVNDFEPIEKQCGCYTCRNYSRAYIAHLFRSGEMLAATLSSIHNLYFLVNIVNNMRNAILEDKFENYKKEFFAKYQS